MLFLEYESVTWLLETEELNDGLCTSAHIKLTVLR